MYSLPGWVYQGVQGVYSLPGWVYPGVHRVYIASLGGYTRVYMPPMYTLVYASLCTPGYMPPGTPSRVHHAAAPCPNSPAAPESCRTGVPSEALGSRRRNSLGGRGKRRSGAASCYVSYGIRARILRASRRRTDKDWIDTGGPGAQGAWTGASAQRGVSRETPPRPGAQGV